jgi:glyoxylase-like metal-dependent hydrolase (beta-lactamase superfamily II)
MKTWQTGDGQTIRRMLGGRSNAFLLSRGTQHVLIDAGPRLGYSVLRRNLARLGIPQDGLAALVLTHAHFDHAENANRVQRDYNTRIIIQQEDAGCLSRGENPMIVGTTRLTRPLTNLLGKRVLSLAHYPPVTPDNTFDESFDLNPLGMNAYLLHTPGHSPGSASVIINGEIALVGDTLFGVFRSATFPPFADLPLVLIASWRKLLDTGCTLFLPSHGGAVTRELLQREYVKYTKRAEDFSGGIGQRPIL